MRRDAIFELIGIALVAAVVTYWTLVVLHKAFA